jgi:hypothetical protein
MGIPSYTDLPRHGGWLALTGVAVEKLGFPKISANSGDRKCLGDPRKSFVGHPDASRFWQISRKRVFQQPQAFTLPTPVRGVVGEMGIFHQTTS